MLTKDDFLKSISDSIDQYPAVAALYRASDPRIMQNLSAMAAMLAMYSAQVEVAQSEPFSKARDATILADASMRGIVPKGQPCRVRLSVENKSKDAYTVDSGRVLLDSNGRKYRVETSATIGQGESGHIEATQIHSERLTHTVFGSVPFYSIEIPKSEDGSHLSSVSISDSKGLYEYRSRYVNSWPDERIYNIEICDRQTVFARFGFDGVVGVQPNDGEKIELVIYRTFGKIDVRAGSPFSFEYIHSPIETAIGISMEAMLIEGQGPISINVLRDLARYPSIYDESAVFLGEFDFLVRRRHPNLRFLSVWNEAAEERARGPNIDNINALFVACLSSSGEEEVVEGAGDGGYTPPRLIDEEDLTEAQKAIRQTILSADDSYRVKFYTAVKSKIEMRVTATVSTSYVSSDVKRSIEEALLREFGEDAEQSKRGGSKPLYRRVYELLKARIPSLSDGEADLQVFISGHGEPIRPENWRFVASESLSVSVFTTNITTPAWGG